jgi:transposase-like protein
MVDERRVMSEVMGLTEGAPGATGVKPITGSQSGPLKSNQRWSARRKGEVVLRLLRGESVQALSRELGVEIYRLEEWRSKAMSGIESSLRERGDDPLQRELDAALKRIGEITMENELLRVRIDKQGPLSKGRSRL